MIVKGILEINKLDQNLCRHQHLIHQQDHFLWRGWGHTRKKPWKSHQNPPDQRNKVRLLHQRNYNRQQNGSKNSVATV